MANNQSTDDADESDINMLILLAIRKNGMTILRPIMKTLRHLENFKTLRPIMKNLTLLQFFSACVLVSNRGPYVISAPYDMVRVLKQLSKELKLLLSIICQESKTKHLRQCLFSRAKLLLFNK